MSSSDFLTKPAAAAVVITEPSAFLYDIFIPVAVAGISIVYLDAFMFLIELKYLSAL